MWGNRDRIKKSFKKKRERFKELSLWALQEVREVRKMWRRQQRIVGKES